MLSYEAKKKFLLGPIELSMRSFVDVFTNTLKGTGVLRCGAVNVTRNSNLVMSSYRIL